ncbi:histone deacetylase 11 [Brevipalpus obovatus]|uniref:histone deacetylase 11 n=1 Tax=Brevipalpus obovatus TaxID=246614 RepID=UPI003D9EEEFA
MADSETEPSCWSRFQDCVSNCALHQYQVSSDQLSIVYSKNYDMGMFGMEKLHPFDTKKWGKIAQYLKDFINNQNKRISFIAPLRTIENEELRLVHTDMFIKSLNTSKLFNAKATELSVLAITPMSVIQTHLITPIKYQTAGSVLAGYLALKHGYAINLGGGFHHCSSQSAGGFCLIADITLLIKYLWAKVDSKLKVMIVDLDAHQGNGHENDALEIREKDPSKKDQLYILDMYNLSVYPHDHKAKEAIDCPIPLTCDIGDEEYLSLLKKNLPKATKTFQPDLIVYNAGTDILAGDPLGAMEVSPKGVIQRDEFVFTHAKSISSAIVMLTSGGYQKSNARVIADSLINLIEKKIIQFSLPDLNPLENRIKSGKPLFCKK